MQRRAAPQFFDVSTRRFLLIQGIISRSRAPTFSICSSAVMRRRLRSVGAPARFSSTNSLAYSPDWMRASTPRMRLRVSSSMIFGPEVYSPYRSEEHTSELQSRLHLVCRLLLEKKKLQ